MRYNESVARLKQPSNPFYGLLVVVGFVFCVTACAYGLMVLKTTRVAESRQADQAPNPSGEALLHWMDQHGMLTMGIELGILGVATVGAIWLDSRRAASELQNPDQSNNSAA